MSMQKVESVSSDGLGLFSVLGIVFIIFKLLEKIDWSWYWVLSPFHLPLTLAVVLLSVFYLITSKEKFTSGVVIGITVLLQGLLYAWIG